jgi:hypothetical protein
VSLGISIAAILIAGLALYLSYRAERRAARTEERSLRAEIAVEFYGSSAGTYADNIGPRTYRFSIRNVGAAPARGVQLWLADRSGNRVSTEMVTRELVLAPDEPRAEGSVVVEEDRAPADLDIWISYADDQGEVEKRVDLELS